MERKRDSHALCKEAVTCWKQERAAERVRNPRVCRESMPNPRVCRKSMPNPRVRGESMPNPRVCRESMPRLWLTPGRNTYERRKKGLHDRRFASHPPTSCFGLVVATARSITT